MRVEWRRVGVGQTQWGEDADRVSDLARCINSVAYSVELAHTWWFGAQ